MRDCEHRPSALWTQDEYVRVSKKVYKAMMEEWDEADAEAEGLADWERGAPASATLRCPICARTERSVSVRLDSARPAYLVAGVHEQRSREGRAPHLSAHSAASVRFLLLILP